MKDDLNDYHFSVSYHLFLLFPELIICSDENKNLKRAETQYKGPLVNLNTDPNPILNVHKR